MYTTHSNIETLNKRIQEVNNANKDIKSKIINLTKDNDEKIVAKISQNEKDIEFNEITINNLEVCIKVT